MDRREFFKQLGFLGAAGVMLSNRGLEVRVGRRPNVIVIISDDMGYADVGCYGGTDIPTPGIDRIAAKGVRFTNGYVSCPVCSPTRAGLITGRYQNRFGHEDNTKPPPPEGPDPIRGLPVTEITIADVMKSAGYATGMIGKWHLGLSSHFHPFKRGFDEFFGFLHGNHTYIDPLLGSFNPILRGYEPVDEQEYLTDAFNREAVAFIDRHKDEPFFLYLAYNAVHTPMQAPERYQDSFGHITDPTRRIYAGMLTAMDDGIVAVLDKVEELGLEDDTLVIFVNDNGGAKNNGSGNLPLRAQKGSMYEGGIRVAFIVKWPSRLPQGTVYDGTAIALDILPTAAAAGDAKVPDDRVIDGVNLLPYLKGRRQGNPHETLYWRKGSKYAMRKGDWKLTHDSGESELYDLANDIGESQNMAVERSDILAELENLYAAWESEMMDPLW